MSSVASKAATNGVALANARQSKSIAEQDKALMHLQQQLELKEAQLKQDYRRLQRDVKQNPYLQVALEEYKTYFAKDKEEKAKKVKALSTLLNYVKEESDVNAIKREIIQIKRK
jgi:hypothetical protein